MHHLECRERRKTEQICLRHVREIGKYMVPRVKVNRYMNLVLTNHHTKVGSFNSIGNTNSHFIR